MAAIAFYRDRLGFELTFLEADDNPDFAIVERGRLSIMIKALLPEVPPFPSAEEFTSRGVALRRQPS